MSSAKQGGPVQPSTSVWRPLGADEIQVTGGIWGRKQRLNADTILGHCETWMERIGWAGNFDRAAAGAIGGRHSGIEFVDSEIYKLLEAMAWELGREHSGDLDAPLPGPGRAGRRRPGTGRLPAHQLRQARAAAPLLRPRVRT